MKKIPAEAFLVLASQSPRRKKILEFVGIPFRVVRPKGVVEKRLPGEAPERMVKRLALEKAISVYKHYPREIVLGADTMVVLGEKVFGKPMNRQEASDMLGALWGRAHRVLTGVAIVGKGGREIWSHCEETKVFFRRVNRRERASYLSSREPYDKAGGYDIQGQARYWVKDWRGDYFNVMGLPVKWILKKLNKPGMRS